jgi:hypothetical protein
MECISEEIVMVATAGWYKYVAKSSSMLPREICGI